MNSWKIAQMEACSLPEPAATAFSQAFQGFIGATYTPVLYCGEQSVHGTNYMVICHQTLMCGDEKEHVVKVIINKSLPGDADPTCGIISIEPII